MIIPNLQIPHWDTTRSDGGAHYMPVHDVFSTDDFRMFQFKVRSCPRGRSDDWTECPYAHPAEKARRRDPRKYHYSAIACPEFRKGNCNRGDSCHFAHGVFECWLHPSRYRTQLCKDGTDCRRKVCFFAHTAEQLRFFAPFVSSPTSVLNSSWQSDSPPSSPVRSMRNVRLDDVSLSYSGLTRGLSVRPGFSKLEEEPATMVRVESGRELRARIYAKLSRENSIVQSDAGFSVPIPDIGWVSELVK